MDGDGSFAAVLRAARHALGLTLEELAEASGVSARALSDMERGRALGPQRRTVESIADALKLEGDSRDHLLTLAKAGRIRSAYVAAAPGLCELPGSIGDFTGRAAELAWISDAVDGPADGSTTAVISGGAGLGKTTLVVRAAHALRDEFPGGVHFVDALGMSGRPVGSGEILARVLRALGVRDQQMPQDPAERAGRYRQLLRERRALVVVDDAASEAQVRPLLPGGGDSRLLVTSRRMLAGLAGVQRLHLDPMPVVDASDLLGHIVAERAPARHDEDLRGLLALLGGLPLALRIAGNRLVSRPQWSVADLVGRLSATERRLDQLSAGDLRVAAAFDMSYEQLGPAARQVFRRVALVSGADFSAALASVVAEVAVPVAEDQLDDLVDLGLMETVRGDRYRLHDLVRLYARQRLDTEDPPDTVATASRRMATWLLDTLTAAGQWFEPGGIRTGFAAVEEADGWIHTESEHWRPALGAAALTGDDDAVVRAAGALHWFSDRWVDWDHWAEVFTLGHDSAARLGDPGRQAEFLNYVAWTYTLPWRDKRTAVAYAERALALARTANDVLQEAWALEYTARAQRTLGDLTSAMTATQRAAELFEQAGDVDASSQTWLSRGDILMRLGNVHEALADFQHALEMVEDPASGVTATIAEAALPHVLAHIGRALGLVGRASEGIPVVRRALDLVDSGQRRLEQATFLQLLADLYGEGHAEAQASLRHAADLYEAVGLPEQAADLRTKASGMGGS